LTFEKHIKP